MKKIVFVTGVLSDGGAERVISVIADSLANQGYDINILTIFGAKNDYLFNPRVNIVPLESKSKNNVYSTIRKLRLMRREIKKINPDIIISFVAIINIYTIISTLFLSKKLIISERNDPYQNPENKYIRFLRNVLYLFADHIVFQTEDAKRYFSSKIQDKGSIIHNPLSSKLPNWEINNSEKVIITASRLTEQKNLPMLIDAFAMIENEFPNYTLKIFGIGDLREILVDYVKKIGLEKKINFQGFTENIHDEMSKASLFVLSSNYEGISNAMLEALAIGVPVISTDSPIGGAKMFIKDNYNGFLVKTGDTKGLASVMRKVLNDKNLAQSISYEAKKIQKILNKDEIINEWIKLIEK